MELNSGNELKRQLHRFSLLAGEMVVHKRTALNARDQVQLILREKAPPLALADIEYAILQIACQDFERYSKLSSIQSYLRQNEIAQTVDLLCQNILRALGHMEDVDEILMEDLQCQKELLETDRKADNISLRRLLRDALRQNQDRIRAFIGQLSSEEMTSLIQAIRTEMTSSRAPNAEYTEIYEKYLKVLEGLYSRRTSPDVPRDLTGKLVAVSTEPIAFGAIASVKVGELFGERVSIHTITNEFDDPDVADLRANVRWATFDHPRVMPLLGVAYDYEGPGRNALISPWMANGTALNYIREHPEVDRLKLISQFASGLTYLHGLQPPYVHALISPSCVLVNSSGDAVLGGFASAAFLAEYVSGAPWLAPEVMRRRTPPNLASDIHSFAMTAYTIMTTQEPFHTERSQLKVIQKILDGGRPERPSESLSHFGFDDRFWKLLRRCWAHDPVSRPSAAAICEELGKLRELPSLDVPDISDSVRLENDDILAVSSVGGFGDIRRGIIKGTRQVVALKALAVRGASMPILRTTKRFRREATIWSRLDHCNILPFLGIADLQGLPTCLVSPWIQNGSCLEYLKNNPARLAMPIILGVCRGLNYLHGHEPIVVHGDLRAANVLISDDGEPLLCDFGLAVIVEDLTKMPISSALKESGNPRWMAPELLMQDNLVSKHSDVWSFGMFVLEALTHEMPFNDIKSYPQVILAIHASARPQRPGLEAEQRGLNDSVWQIMQQCWSQDPNARPTSSQLLRMFGDVDVEMAPS